MSETKPGPVIDRIETFILRLDEAAEGPRYRALDGVRSVYPAGAEVLLVKATAGDLVGWGEALAPVTPEAPDAIIRHLFAPLLMGQRVEGPSAITRGLRELMRERGHLGGHQADAIAGIDIALWDLWGKAVERPIWQLLGGRARDTVELYHSAIPGSSDEERADAAQALRAQGARRMKLHLLAGAVSALETFDVVQSAVPDVSIAVDTHWSLELRDALWLGRNLDERRAWFFEAPLSPEDTAGHARLSAELATPIANGEALRHRFEVRDLLDARALGLLQPDVGRTGISEAIGMATLAASRDVAIAPHHSMALGIAYAAGLHVCVAAEQVAGFEFHPSTLERTMSITGVPFEIRGMSALPSEAPGLGVTVDEGLVRRLARP